MGAESVKMKEMLSWDKVGVVTGKSCKKGLKNFFFVLQGAAKAHVGQVQKEGEDLRLKVHEPMRDEEVAQVELVIW